MLFRSYHVFEKAGGDWLNGADLYHRDGNFDVFHYSPLMAAFLSPLGMLPSGFGNFMVRFVNFLVFFPALFCWLRARSFRAWTTRQCAVFLVLLGLLCHNDILDMQFTLLLSGLLLGTMAAVARERWFLAALLCALAVYLKTYPLALALLLDRKSTRLNSSHIQKSRMPSSA